MATQRVYRERNYAFGQQLLALRTRAALTQIAFAEQVGVHRRSVQNWETGESYPKTDTLQRLIATLVRHGAFTPGREHEEASDLWQVAARDGSHPIGSFDAAWFAALLPLQGAAGGGDWSKAKVPAAPQARSSLPVSVVDWGEAIAAPTLYGRDAELATLRAWVLGDRCRVVTLFGLGGVGKSSLASMFAHHVVGHFDAVFFHALQNAPPLADLLDRTIRAISPQQAALPEQVSEKIALLVQVFRERRCLVILDNFESLLQPGALAGTYRSGYAEYATLLHALGTRAHESCLVLTSREKLAELSPLEGANAPVRLLPLAGLDTDACRAMLAAKGISESASHVEALARRYGGNPLALMLVAEPVRELFGGDIGAFLAAGDSFFDDVGKLLEQQLVRSTPLEQTVLYALAIERELAPLGALLATLRGVVPQRDILGALESLRRRLLIERARDRPAFTLQPVILEFITDQLVGQVAQEIATARPRLLLGHALIQVAAKDYVRRAQERLILAPLLESLAITSGTHPAEHYLLALLDAWRSENPAAQGNGPGNVVNLLRLLRVTLRGLDLSRLTLRGAYLQGVEMQDATLRDAVIQNSVFTETFDAISAVAVSSSGEHVAAGGRRGEVQVWSAGGFTLHLKWRAHADMVSVLAFSPVARTLITAGAWDGTVKAWDIANGALLWAGRQSSRINRGAFSPNGSVFATSANDGTVQIWDAQSGAPLHTLEHPNLVLAVAWSPTGLLLASGDLAGKVYVWEVNKGVAPRLARTLTGHTNSVEGLAFAPNGATLASASWDSTVRLWAMPSGQLREALSGYENRIGHVAWSSDGRALAVAGADPAVWLWNVEHGAYYVVLQGHAGEVTGLTFTPDGQGLLSGGEDGTLRIWDVASRQCVRVVQGYAESLYDIAWSPDGAQLVSAGSDTTVTIFTVSGAAPPVVLSGHGGVVIGADWSADGQYIASSEWENAVRLWDAQSGRCLQVLQHQRESHNFFDRLAWSPDGKRLACGTYALGVEVFDVAAQRPPPAGFQLPTWIRHVAWSPDGSFLAGGGADGSVYVWNSRDGVLLQQLGGHQTSITDIAWSVDGSRLVAACGSSTSGELDVWDTRRWERIHAITGHTASIRAVAWGGGPEIVVSGDSDGTLCWWDVQRSKPVLVREAHNGTIHTLRRSPDGARLASCGDDGAIMIWDVWTGAHLQTLRRDRPYERLNIAGATGITSAQRASLVALGAVE